MDNVFTKVDKYGLNASQRKLLEVLLNPENFTLSITDICKEADISRPTYYKHMQDERFIEIYNEVSVDMLKAHIPNILNATVEYAKEKNGHQDRKMLLTMTGLYADKLETKADVKLTDPCDDLTAEELRQLIEIESRKQ